MKLYELTLSQMLRAIERGTCTALDIATQCRERMAALEPAVRAWASLEEPEPWLAHWRETQGHALQRPFKGLPMGVKDTIDATGFTAERGSRIWAGRMPAEDAACVAALRAAGLHVAGKTVTTEFAYFAPGPTCNPYRLQHTPGGSSSGSAAAVAAEMVPVALGSQTAASVIRPASFCGVAGYVASTGRYSLRGVMPLAWSFDSLGIMARSVEDVQRVAAALNAGAFDDAPADIEVQTPRAVLACDGSAFGPVDPAMAEAFEAALAQMQRAGIRVERLRESTQAESWVLLHQRWMAFEGARTLAFEFENFRDALSAPLRTLIDEGLRMGGEEQEAMERQCDKARQALHESLGECDLIVAPAAPGPAPAGLAATGAPHMSRPWQLFGLPQITLPMARDAQGLPLGIQLIGRAGEDRRLLTLARTCEQAFDWRFVRPAPERGANLA